MKIRNFRLSLLWSLIAVTVTLTLGACSGKKSADKPAAATEAAAPRMLVAYFSAQGHTRAQAERLAQLTGADLFAITPAQAYTNADLDWHDKSSRSSVEMADTTARPGIGVPLPDVASYDIIFLGYPNWWNTAPRIINTFLESADFSGALIAPFMTSGGGEIAQSEADLRGAYPTLRFAPGMLMNEVNEKDIFRWTAETKKLLRK